jgi:hypothetical protein
LLGEVMSQAARFVGGGMPATFVAHLQGLIAAFEATIQERDATREGRVAARARRTEALSTAMAAVRALDMIVANHLAADPVTQAVWKRERRIAYPRPDKDNVPPTPAGAA